MGNSGRLSKQAANRTYGGPTAGAASLAEATAPYKGSALDAPAPSRGPGLQHAVDALDPSLDALAEAIARAGDVLRPVSVGLHNTTAEPSVLCGSELSVKLQDKNLRLRALTTYLNELLDSLDL